jgi:predicted CopG family antitoxin
MIKTQIQLETAQYEELKRLGASEARSLSDLVRESVTLLLARSQRRAARSLEEVAGKYERGDAGDLKDHDRGWAESIR